MSLAKRDAVVPPVRPEFERAVLDARNIGEIVRPLSHWERVTNITAVRRFFILVLLALLWQAYSVPLDNPLLSRPSPIPWRHSGARSPAASWSRAPPSPSSCC